MVSKQNKKRLQSAASAANKAVRKAGKAYWNYSGKVAEKMAQSAANDTEKSATTATKILQNPEPNQPDDIALANEIHANHQEVMRLLQQIRDDLSHPVDSTAKHEQLTNEFDWMGWL